MDQYQSSVLGQIIDNQLSLNRKMDTIIQILSNLSNTIIKYDNDYNEEMLKHQGVE